MAFTPDLSMLYVARYIGYAALLAGFSFFFLNQRKPLSDKLPKTANGDHPILGALRFFTARWDFFRSSVALSKTGQFSFHVGNHTVVGLSGLESRRLFFDSPNLNSSEGYAILFGASPNMANSKEDNALASENNHFGKTLTYMLRKELLVRGLPNLIKDTEARMEDLAKSQTKLTDPFESIYGVVFQLTMRTVGCVEVARDPKLLKKVLGLFEAFEKSTTAAAIIFPWLPGPAIIKRAIAAGQLHTIFKKIVDDRGKTGRKEEDPLQVLIDRGDNMGSILSFIVGALFAGQLNSGINAAYVLAYMALEPRWMDQCRVEVNAVLDKYSPDRSTPIKDRLLSIPIEAWETGFETVDLCMRDSIRLQLLGSTFRRNISGQDIKIGDEVIPNGAFVAYHLGDIHHDPSIYKDSWKWDPTRYLEPRNEDKKMKYGWLGWGAGRHMCLGMRFAKLEQNLIVASFLSHFDYSVVELDGTPMKGQPEVDLNGHSAHKPAKRFYLKYENRTTNTA